MSEGRMTAEQTPDIEAVLAEHRPRHLAQDAFHTPVTCICGPGWNRDQHPTWEAHVADRLAAAVLKARAAELREAADEVDLSGEYDPSPLGLVSHSCAVAEEAAGNWLRERADRIAVDAPEGGEGR